MIGWKWPWRSGKSERTTPVFGRTGRGTVIIVTDIDGAGLAADVDDA